MAWFSVLISTVSRESALDSGLMRPDPAEKHVDFIAENVPDLVATEDRKGMSAMDVVTVLTKVVQDQQTIEELSRKVAALEQK